jgi:hypothetical protein
MTPGARVVRRFSPPPAARVIRARRVLLSLFAAFAPCTSSVRASRFLARRFSKMPYYDLARAVGASSPRRIYRRDRRRRASWRRPTRRWDVGGRSVGCNILLPVEQKHNAYLDYWVTFHHFLSAR